MTESVGYMYDKPLTSLTSCSSFQALIVLTAVRHFLSPYLDFANDFQKKQLFNAKVEKVLDKTFGYNMTQLEIFKNNKNTNINEIIYSCLFTSVKDEVFKKKIVPQLIELISGLSIIVFKYGRVTSFYYISGLIVSLMYDYFIKKKISIEKIRKNYYQEFSVLDELYRELLVNMRLIKGGNNCFHEKNRFMDQLKKYDLFINSYNVANFFQNFIRGLSTGIIICGFLCSTINGLEKQNIQDFLFLYGYLNSYLRLLANISLSWELYRKHLPHEEKLAIFLNGNVSAHDLQFNLKENFENILEIDNITIKSEKSTILNNFSWHIEKSFRGRIAIVGKSGVGKSTIFNLISGLDIFANEENIHKIRFRNFPISHIPPVKLFNQIRIVNQNSGVFAHENLKYNILYEFHNDQKSQEQLLDHCNPFTTNFAFEEACFHAKLSKLLQHHFDLVIDRAVNLYFHDFFLNKYAIYKEKFILLTTLHLEKLHKNDLDNCIDVMERNISDPKIKNYFLLLPIRIREGYISKSKFGMSQWFYWCAIVHDGIKHIIFFDAENQLINFKLYLQKRKINLVSDQDIKTETKNPNSLEKCFRFLENYDFRLLDYQKNSIKFQPLIGGVKIYNYILKKSPNGLLSFKLGNISQGEKQRISAGRIFAKKKKFDILLLDEPTSALDSLTEFQLMENYKNFCKLYGKMMILVTHRLNIIVNFNKIICIDKGKIVGSGSHSELLSSNKYYQLLWKSQNAYFYKDDKHNLFTLNELTEDFTL